MLAGAGSRTYNNRTTSSLVFRQFRGRLAPKGPTVGVSHVDSIGCHRLAQGKAPGETVTTSEPPLPETQPFLESLLVRRVRRDRAQQFLRIVQLFRMALVVRMLNSLHRMRALNKLWLFVFHGRHLLSFDCGCTVGRCLV